MKKLYLLPLFSIVLAGCGGPKEQKVNYDEFHAKATEAAKSPYVYADVKAWIGTLEYERFNPTSTARFGQHSSGSWIYLSGSNQLTEWGIGNLNFNRAHLAENAEGAEYYFLEAGYKFVKSEGSYVATFEENGLLTSLIENGSYYQVTYSQLI